MRNDRSKNELDAIELMFIDEWNKGEKPTLANYIAKYPQYEEELTDFVLLLAISETTTSETKLGESPSITTMALVEQALAASRSNAQTLNQRLQEIGSAPDDLATELDLPKHILAELQARRLTDLPRKLISALARRFCQTVDQTLELVGYRSKMANPTFQMRAIRPSATHRPQVQTFREAMQLCQAKGLATNEQIRKWLDEEDS